MRKACFDTLVDLATDDDRIWLLTADMGYGLVDEFASKFPDRFINVGVAEQNMIGVAAGLALSGKVVFVYSIGNFPTLRCLEQIRNDLCYHNLNVNILAGGTGVTYGALGFSHHAIEDIAVMRSLPNMRVAAPGTTRMASMLVAAYVGIGGPSYMRLGFLPKTNPADYFIDSATLYFGDVAHPNIVLLCTGVVGDIATQAVSVLRRRGLSVNLQQVSELKPLDQAPLLQRSIGEARLVVTIEEHRTIGGLGSIVAEVLTEAGVHPDKVIRIGVDDTCPHEVHSREDLLERNGLTVEKIVERVLSCVE